MSLQVMAQAGRKGHWHKTEGYMLMLNSSFICMALCMCSGDWAMDMNVPWGHEEQYTCALSLINICRYDGGNYFVNQ